ncbi:ATP-dependent helicase [Corynebacterium sp. H113]|uniref:ATP-dependent helicase n=1 Tax=Corynebacterium sp. H113 TaxID=3133419 RepID=UPI00309A21F9
MSNSTNIIDPVALSHMMEQKFAPTEQQAAVIGAPMEPMLVVAGAGAGKTETMAARVVWLVANGFVRPEEVLGLTFTRKAASELGQRIRARLATLAASPEFRKVANPDVLEALEVIVPTVKTYDAYAGSLVKEYGLLLPAEPSAEVIDTSTQWQMAWDIATNASSMKTKLDTGKLVEKLMKLSSEIDSNLVDEQEVREQTEAFIHTILQTPKSARQKKDLHSGLVSVLDAQRDRLELLPLVEELRQRYADDHVVTFGMQMSQAARLADGIAEVGESQRKRFKVVMLDEYQDTSHAQRVLLRGLFAGNAVTAVGDPMQAIYGWRGATASNLIRFVDDFPQSNGQPASKLQLVTSWRNPESVLEVANIVSDKAFRNQQRTVERLTPRPGAHEGTVSLALHSTVHEELTWIADRMASEYATAQAEGRHFSAAVLVRGNKDSAPVLDALTSVGVPAEIVGLGGLLSIPEIMDIVAVLRVLADPADNEAMLRILTSPFVQLGAADLEEVKRRARQISNSVRDRSTANTTQQDETELEKLDATLESLVQERAGEPVGLGYAIADPAIDDDGPRAPQYSEEGARRIADLSMKLGGLRRWSLHKPLPELVSDVEVAFGIRIEATVAGAAEQSTATAGTVHLDKFIEVAAEYSRRIGGELLSFLSFLQRAEQFDRGLEPGKVKLRGDAVEIMTVHKSKGLEWDIVAVPHVCESVYDKVRLENWTTKAELLMPELIGNDSGANNGHGSEGSLETDELLNGAPVLDTSAAENQGELVKAIAEHKDELKTAVSEESERLFYVAVTRAAKTLLVSGCQRKGEGKKSVDGPSEQLIALAAARPQDVEVWESEASADPLEVTDAEGIEWPVDPLGERREAVTNAAHLVGEALTNLHAQEPTSVRPIGGDISQVWDMEVSMLLDERRHVRESAIEVELPVQLSASEYIAMRQDPDAFARRKARPVPFKPNRFARRGTAFHAWLESFFSTQALLDDEDIFAIAEEFGADFGEDLAVDRLKEIFKNSEWADRTPECVEVPFDISLGGQRVVGRIDAVFRIDGRWVVVDWKTGKPATGHDLSVKALQLAIYRIAWSDRLRAEGQDVPLEDVGAAFFYLNPAGRSETVWPGEGDLPNRLELVQAIQDSVRR